jgi:ribonuclease R
MTTAIRDHILHLLRQLGRPAGEKDLLKLLRVKGDARLAARKALEEMVAAGEVVETRTGRFGLPEKMNLVVGRLECKAGGFGFVVPEGPAAKEGRARDVYVSGAQLGEALHGDRVLVRIERTGREGRPEGRILEVLARVSQRMVGRLEADVAGATVVPFDARFLYQVQIPAGALGGAQPGDMVAVELTRFPGRFRSPMGRVVEVLGPIDEPGVDVRVMIAKYELPDEFPKDALDEAERIPTEVEAARLTGRSDFRNEPIVTIDGETARDFDDAVQVKRLPNGNYQLGVHIADVSHYVAPGSALDQEAFRRGTSVYFPERAVPMLPERLSNGICSLNPGVDRLVQSVLIEVSPSGRIVNYEFYDGVIRSRARMTYTAVRQILVDRDPAVRERYSPLLPDFERMLALYEILRVRREKRGSIDFDLPEPEILLDLEGVMTGVVAAERNVAHRIIEEFMLLANEVVAGHLAHLETPSLYRVHEEPDPRKVEEFEEFIAGFGYTLRGASEPLKPRNFQRLLARIAGKPEERLISYLMLRSMAQARYQMENVGHYGLAAPLYTHFTSPIRRYPDLVVHRLLREVRQSGPSAAERQEELLRTLPEVGEHSSRTERRAAEAEQELVDWKKVRFMADKVGDVLAGYVTGVSSFGLFVELEDHFVEGLVHISTLVDDYYRFDERGHTLRGESTRKVYRLGDRLEVLIVRVDLERRRIDLAVEGLEPAPGQVLRSLSREVARRSGHRGRGRARRWKRGR